MPRLTDVTVAQAKPRAIRIEVADAIVPGLRLVIQPSGFKSWACRYRLGRRQVKLTLGPYPRLPLAAARTAARKALESVALGTDPSVAKRGEGSVDSAVALYTERRIPELRPETRAATTRELGHMVDAWRGRLLRSITRADVRKLVDDAQARGPAAANMLNSKIKAFLTWCVERDLIEVSPATGIKRPSKVVQRDRVLDDGELAAVWHVADRVGGSAGAAVKLLILTGCRRNEISHLRSSEIKADAIELPGERTKTGEPHRVPLTAAMRTILAGLPEGLHLGTGNHAIKNKMTADIPAWTIHDLRRSFATGLARLGVAPHVIEKCLNHKLGGIAGIYQRHDYAAEMRDAFERWSDHITRISARKACDGA
jgi:integrase